MHRSLAKQDKPTQILTELLTSWPPFMTDAQFLSYFSYFDKNNKSRLMRSPCSLCVCVSPLLNFESLNQSL
jgi:hypothetical protein